MAQPYKYYAFISYNSQDTKWGARVQRKLERYRMPATLCREHGWQRTPIKPVFFAPTDIQPGGLNEELQERLRASHYLIVICSPNSAKSEWVGKEIAFFHSLGRTKQIHFFIVDGTPHSGDPQTECFNPVVDTLGLPEILGANIHERIYRWPWLNKERAYVQLISKLLGVEFDTIWQRHKRQLVQRMVAWAVGLAVVTALWIATMLHMQPFTSEISVQDAEPNSQLPPFRGGVATLYLDDEQLTDTLFSFDESAVFRRVPHRYLNQPVRITITPFTEEYLGLDSTFMLTTVATLLLQRNPDYYGNVSFIVWDINSECPVPNCTITIGNVCDEYSITSDTAGHVSLHIPLAAQRREYTVASTLHLLTTTLPMPCDSSTALLVGR